MMGVPDSGMTGTSIPAPTPYASTGNEAFLPRSIIDPKGGRDRGRRLLVVSTVDDAAGKLRGYTKPVDTIKVVVPAVRHGWLDWLDWLAMIRRHSRTRKTSPLRPPRPSPVIQPARAQGKRTAHLRSATPSQRSLQTR